MVLETIKKEGVIYSNDASGSYSIRPYNYRTSFIQLAPTLGISYDFTERISASIESNIFLQLFTISKNEMTYDHPLSTLFPSGIDPSDRFHPFVNPISLFSVNYKFNATKNKNGIRYK